MRWLLIIFLAGIIAGCDARIEIPEVLSADVVVEEQRFPVHDAVLRADVNALNELHNEGAALDEPNADGSTPLILAVEQSQVEAVQWLLEHGVDANGASGTSKSALNRAIEVASGYDRDTVEWQHSSDILEVLLEHGANPHEHLNGYPSAVQRAMDLQCEWCLSLMKDVSLKRGAELGRTGP